MGQEKSEMLNAINEEKLEMIDERLARMEKASEKTKNKTARWRGGK